MIKIFCTIIFRKEFGKNNHERTDQVISARDYFQDVIIRCIFGLTWHEKRLGTLFFDSAYRVCSSVIYQYNELVWHATASGACA